MLVVSSPGAPTNEAQYLEWKWRRNLADPATGLDYPTVSRQLPALMAEFSRWVDIPADVIIGWAA